jgi:hypothetical protein
MQNIKKRKARPKSAKFALHKKTEKHPIFLKPSRTQEVDSGLACEARWISEVGYK